MAAATCADVDLAKPQRLVQLLGAREFELAQELRNRRGIDAQALDLAVEHRPSLELVLRGLLLAKPGADFIAVAGTREKARLGRQPVARGMRGLPGDDLDHVAVLELIVERHDAAVDLGAATAMAQSRCARGRRNRAACRPRGRSTTSPWASARRCDRRTARRASGRGNRRRLRCRRGREQRAQLVDLALVGLIARAAFLVAPVRGDAELGVVVHVVRADLNLERLAPGTDHRGMDRAVVVVLRAWRCSRRTPRGCSATARARCRARRSSRRSSRPRCAPRAHRRAARRPAACAASCARCCRCAWAGRRPRRCDARPRAVRAASSAQTSSM